jgi:signal transduction histidine kinase/DNA-binding response OmpR family regulator/ligand-binding sensor domain-containing protein
MPQTYKYIQLIILVFLPFQMLVAQDLLFDTRHITVEDGLLGRRINSIVQDNDGFMWIATNEGLNRFDGYTFQHFTKESHQLEANHIVSLSIDEQGNIWISYVQNQYERLLIQILYPKTGTIVSLESYLGVHFKEEYNRLNLNNTSTEIILHHKTLGFFRYSTKKGLVSIPKGFLNRDINGNYWVKEQGVLIKYKADHSVLKRISTSYNKISKITNIDEKWSFMIVDADKDQEHFLLKKNEDDDFEIIDKKASRKIIINEVAWVNDVLYFNYEDRLAKFNTSNFTRNKLRCLAYDNRKNIWVGTSDGFYILFYQKKRFNTYLENARVPDKYYAARGIWANQDYLYSIMPDLALRWNFNTNQKEFLSLSHQGRNRRISTTNNSRQIWMASNGTLPLEQIDTLTGKVIQSIPFNDNEKKRPWSIMEDRQGKVWLGGLRKGLWTYTPNQDTKVVPYKSFNNFGDLKNKKIIHIVEDKTNPNYIWMAAEGGWYQVHNQTGVMARFWSKADKDCQISSDNINYTYQENAKIFWLGTALSGLLRVELTNDYKVKDIQKFTIQNGLPSNTIYAIIEDKKGFLWLSSNNGIIKFNKKNGEVQVFSQEDGLSHYEFNRGSSYQRKDGTIFFGSLNGIISFHPKDFHNQSPYDVPLKISKCRKFTYEYDKILDITDKVIKDNRIVLKPSNPNLVITVSLQDYFYSPDLKYAYQVEGFHKEFITSKNNEITLKDIPYGNYKLRIKGQGKDGRYSTQELKIKLIVPYPFHLIWWVDLIALIILFLGIRLFFRWRVRNLKEKQRQLEKTVLERTKQISSDKAIIEEQAKDLKELDKMKSRFFANISHELRTPLTLIFGPVNSMLDSKRLENRNSTYASMIKQNALKLEKRINEILDLTKLEADKMILKPQPTYFYGFTKRLAATFESFAQQKQQQLIFRYNLDKNLQILVDQDKFEHIFNNYLSNAIKYTAKEGTIRVVFSEEKMSKEKDIIENRIVLEVKDNGLGLHPDDLPHIFNRFYQAKHGGNNENNYQDGGSGIGLALSKEIAQLMNGSVSAESNLGIGSVFSFKMPYEEYLGVIKNETKTINHVPNTILIVDEKEVISKDKPTVLLVEDNYELRQYIKLILSERYNIITTENGQEALEWLTETQKAGNQPSLIISDIMMPVMDGFELLKTLKSSDEWRHIPVVMLTARSSSKAKLEALHIGVDDYLLKPFNDKELVARIDNLLINTFNRKLDIGDPESTIETEPTTKKSEPLITESDSQWLKEVEQCLQKELSKSNFNASELANLLNLSRRQLQRRIKKSTGLTPAQYIKEARLQTARQILENGTFQTVNEITFAVGFDTAWYFSRLYEDRFGKKPIDYLK